MVALFFNRVRPQRCDAFMLFDMVIGMMVMSIILNGLIEWGGWLDQNMVDQSNQFDSSIQTLNTIQLSMTDSSIELNKLNLCEYRLFDQPIVVVCEQPLMND